MCKIIKLIPILLCISCSNLAVSLTPDGVKDSVSKAAAIARFSAQNPPDLEHIQQFLKANADAWNALEQFYIGTNNENR